MTLVRFEDLLEGINMQSPCAWVFMPRAGNWGPDSMAAVSELEEVPADHERDPNAGIPSFARQYDLALVLPVATVQDIVANARLQKPSVTKEEIFAAFEYYYQHDAFIALEG